MRGITKVMTAVGAVGLAATMAACSSSAAKPEGSFSKLTGKSTTVVAAASFVKALTSLGVTPGIFGKATVPAAGEFSFPITGGNATIYKKGDKTPYVSGVIDHEGSGLTLKAGATTVTLKNFVVNPGNNSNLTGEVDVTTGGKTTVAAKSLTLFDLDGSTLKPPTISAAGVATLSGTTIYLSADAATALNKVFALTGAKALAGDHKVLIGTAIIMATGTP